MSDERDPSNEPGAGQALGADRLTWAVLLGRWVDFARGALALPSDGDGLRLRESVADIIMLQAVWFALQHVQELDPSERALGAARAAVLIEKHEAALAERWGAALPEKIAELIADARTQLAAASS